jgi:protein-disulfide isomerase/uncharacterized membrane protein
MHGWDFTMHRTTAELFLVADSRCAECPKRSLTALSMRIKRKLMASEISQDSLGNVVPEPPSGGQASAGRILFGALLSWLGVVICWLLLSRESGALGQLCQAGSGCDAVLSSRYATLRGVPLPWLGMGFYLLIFSLLTTAIGSAKSAWRGAALSGAVWLSVSGLAFSALLMWVQFGKLRAFCPLCTASAVVILALVATLAKAEPAEATPGSRLTAMALAGMALFSAAAGALLMGGSQGEVLAIVDGQKFTRQQMEEELAISLQPLEQRKYALETDWVQGKVDEVLLSAEAQRLGTTKAELLAARIATLKPPTSEQIKARLAESKRPMSAENAAVASEELLAELARTGLVGEIASRHRLQFFLPPPKIRALQIDLTTAKTFGPTDAPVQLVVFSDFQCQFCARLAPHLQRIRAEFPNEVMMAFRYFPLETHARAMPAAVAAECAAEQGRFWEYHDRLFAEGGDLSDARLLALATKAGLDEARFRQCLQEDRPKKLVEASQRDAAAVGLEGAPAVFVNGKRVEGNLSYRELVNRIRTELRRAGVESAGADEKRAIR